MLFKSTIIAALLIGLSFAAPHPDLAAEPEAVAVAFAEPQAVNAAESQAGVPMQQQGIVDDILNPGNLLIIGNTVWPIAFNRQCKTLATITANLDKQLAHAKLKYKKFSCTTAQAAEIAKNPTCPIFNLATNVAWPIDFIQQENLTKRIAAQTACLGTYQGTYC